MSDYLDYETSSDDYRTTHSFGFGLHPLCRCGTGLVYVPDDDPNSEDYEWLCPYCDEATLAERKDE